MVCVIIKTAVHKNAVQDIHNIIIFTILYNIYVNSIQIRAKPRHTFGENTTRCGEKTRSVKKRYTILIKTRSRFCVAKMVSETRGEPLLCCPRKTMASLRASKFFR